MVEGDPKESRNETETEGGVESEEIGLEVSFVRIH